MEVDISISISLRYVCFYGKKNALFLFFRIRYQPGAGPNDAQSSSSSDGSTKRTIPTYNAAEFKRSLVTEVNRWRTQPATITAELESLLASTTAWDGDKRFAHPESR